MKIRIVKASGSVVELSDVAGVQVIEGQRLEISCSYPLNLKGPQFLLKLDGPTDGLSVHDPNIKWPLVDRAIG